MKKLLNGQYIEIPEEELEALKQMALQNPLPASPEERIAELEEALSKLLEGAAQ